MDKIYITAEQIEDISCARLEQETTINWGRDDEYAVMCTSDPTMVTKMKRVMENHPDLYRCYYYECNRSRDTGRLGNYFFEVPKKFVSFRGNKTSKKRELSADERKAIGERFKKGRKAAAQD